MSVPVTEQLPELPSAGPVLFLLDSRNPVEDDLLRVWIEASPVARKATEQVSMLSTPLADVGGRSPSDKLAGLLAVNGETVVVPVRVCWKIPGFDQSKGLRLRQLLLGDPRAPGSLRARWTLFRDPGRAACIAGAHSTVTELRQRYEDR